MHMIFFRVSVEILKVSTVLLGETSIGEVKYTYTTVMSVRTQIVIEIHLPFSFAT